MPIDTELDNTFFTHNARFILPVPVPWLALAGMSRWEAVHTGTVARYIAVAGFSGVALLAYPAQRQVHRRRTETQ
jgi:hypothetical protein